MCRQPFPPSGSPPDLSIFCCNICQDLCHDPVVTFCGHIFCWPCLYVSASTHSIPFENIQHCPVCNNNVGDGIVPIYSCGKSSDIQFLAEKFPGTQIPSRPSTPSLERLPGALSQGPALYNVSRNSHRPLHIVRTGSARSGIINPGHSKAVVILYLLLSLFMSFLPSSVRNAIGRYTLITFPIQRRYINEKQFVLHWGFICFGIFATVGFLIC
ncbi:hypothetical protein KP509_18G045400 [Ceratopteris richardii]|uniref:RING-type E3 ubiquitin transferase n=1 Tax=Ceratopteris richardii TaxID=49495 RepID=A0A8T2SPA7_CERRI|nr:hypothetical protein KP509_18G045400 [Ceratopteris richardii]